MDRKLLLLVFLMPLGCGDGDSVPARARGGPVPLASLPLADAGAPASSARAIRAAGRPMLMDFTRDHCLPCKIMAPWVEELRVKLEGVVDVVEINIDRPQNEELGQFFKVSSIPTQVYVDREGREVFRNVGLATRPQMERSLRERGFLGKAE